MSTSYTDATTQLQSYVDSLCAPGQPHEELRGAEFLLLFVDPAPKSRGRVVGGRASKKSGLAAWLYWRSSGSPHMAGEPLLLIEISQQVWDYYGMLRNGSELRTHLIDHELSHFRYDTELETYALRPHDAEIFFGVISRYEGRLSEHKAMLAGESMSSPDRVDNFGSIMLELYGADATDLEVDPRTGEITVIQDDEDPES